MNILQVNKFFYIRDGTSRYYFNLSKLLREKGHRVLSFSMDHPRNRVSPFSKYFVNNVSFDDKTLVGNFLKLPRILYSFQARKNIKELLDQNKVDLVHVHSLYHYLSPSILFEFKKRSIPIVMTAHDYHLIAPNYLLFHDGKICEITKPDKYYKALFHRCIGSSYSSSLMEVIEKYFHSYFLKEQELIDIFIVPSRFVKKKFIEYGFPAKKIVVLPFFAKPKRSRSITSGKYILYFGGLYRQKGVDFLIQVMKNLPEIPCLIVGEGPEEDHLKEVVREEKISNVKLLGYQSESELEKIITESGFTIMPSLWYEGFGMVILEANVLGKPVIASKIGGIPEVIKDGVNGLLFNPGNEKDCQDKIKRLWNDNNLLLKLSRQTQKKVLDDFSSEVHYEKLMKIYHQVL